MEDLFCNCIYFSEFLLSVCDFLFNLTGLKDAIKDVNYLFVYIRYLYIILFIFNLKTLKNDEIL